MQVWTEGLDNWTTWGECSGLFGGQALTDEQINDMMLMLDKDGDGEIDYTEFARWFGRGPPPAPMTPEVRTRMEAQAAAGPQEDHLKAIQRAADNRSRGMMLKLKAALAGVFSESGVGLEQQFRAFDTNGDGAIDHDEFRSGLLALGAQITEEQVDDLVTILDKDGSGEIDYHEFGRWFGRGPPPAPPTPEVKARQEARTASAPQEDHLKAIQRRAESRARGMMLALKRELSNVFTSSGVSLERQFRSFDTDQVGAARAQRDLVQARDGARGLEMAGVC